MENIKNKIKKIEELILTATSSLSSAKKLLLDLSGDNESIDQLHEISQSSASNSSSSRPDTGDEKAIEGTFDGEIMIDPEGFSHPIPANYISKSKLVEGDGLKLTVADDGRFIYKQIKPKPRQHLTGTLTLESDQYLVIAEGKSYKVILAAVTYLKANIGDKISIIIPADKESKWAAIDGVLPS